MLQSGNAHVTSTLWAQKTITVIGMSDWCVDVDMQPENKVLTWPLPSFLYVQETSSNLLE